MNKYIITIAAVVTLAPFFALAQPLNPVLNGNTVTEPSTSNQGLVVHSVQYGFDGTPDQPCQQPTFGAGNGGGGVPFSYQVVLPTTPGSYGLTEEDFFDNACTVQVSLIQTFPAIYSVQAPVVAGTSIGSVNSSSQSGGYMAVCSYVLVYQATCNPDDYSQMRFAFDQAYRESILIPWRFVIFGGKYNQ